MPDPKTLCPHCGKPRGLRLASGELLQTCGSHECHHAAIKEGIRKTYADRKLVLPQLERNPWRSRGEIDFQNGFASQNLTFADDRSRLRT